MSKRILIIALGLLCVMGAKAQTIDIKSSEDYSPFVFGHNLEHTRAAVNSGLSAQMLLNRKFADNEDYSTAATIKDGVVTITLINDSFDTDREFVFNLKGEVLEAKLLSSADVIPYTFFEESPLKIPASRKTVRASLPPHSVALVRIKTQ